MFYTKARQYSFQIINTENEKEYTKDFEYTATVAKGLRKIMNATRKEWQQRVNPHFVWFTGPRLANPGISRTTRFWCYLLKIKEFMFEENGFAAKGNISCFFPFPVFVNTKASMK